MSRKNYFKNVLFVKTRSFVRTLVERTRINIDTTYSVIFLTFFVSIPASLSPSREHTHRVRTRQDNHTFCYGQTGFLVIDLQPQTAYSSKKKQVSWCSSIITCAAVAPSRSLSRRQILLLQKLVYDIPTDFKHGGTFYEENAGFLGRDSCDTTHW